MGKKHGFSFSPNRASGITSMKQRIARETGIPTTKAGFERKVGSAVVKCITRKRGH